MKKEKYYCPNCGEEIEENETNCSKCNAELEWEDTSSEFETKKENHFCAICGKEISLTERYCEDCLKNKKEEEKKREEKEIHDEIKSINKKEIELQIHKTLKLGRELSSTVLTFGIIVAILNFIIGIIMSNIFDTGLCFILFGIGSSFIYFGNYVLSRVIETKFKNEAYSLKCLNDINK